MTYSYIYYIIFIKLIIHIIYIIYNYIDICKCTDSEGKLVFGTKNVGTPKAPCWTIYIIIHILLYIYYYVYIISHILFNNT